MSGGKGGGDKTEKPTARRLKDARRKGSATMRSPEVASWLALLVGSWLVPLTWHRMQGAGRELFAQVPVLAADPDPTRASQVLGRGLVSVLTVTWPLMVVLIGVGLTAAVSQGGLHIATASLKPQWKRIDPLAGAKRMFGVHALWETAKALTRVGLLSVVCWQAGAALIHALTASGPRSLTTALSQGGATAIGILRTCAMVGLGIALVDVVMVRRRVGKSLRMSKQEVKEDHRHSEGDPHIKAMIRGAMLRASRNRMLSQVAGADVVLANPTHVAVAIRYTPSSGAPKVVAKGAGAVAARIRERADEARVPIVVDIPLARAVHRSCEIDQEIPPALFTAVASVLAFVMGLRRRGVHAGTHRLPGGSGVAEGLRIRRRRGHPRG